MVPDLISAVGSVAASTFMRLKGGGKGLPPLGLGHGAMARMFVRVTVWRIGLPGGCTYSGGGRMFEHPVVFVS